MNILDPAVRVLAVMIAGALFIVVALLTRATRRRALGALVSGLPLIPLVMATDAIAAHLGWWYYPPVSPGRPPLSWYIAAALWYGAALGLVGWRAIRRFGAAGFSYFLIGFALVGVTRDYLYSVQTRLIVFGSGPLPLVADMLDYAAGGAVVQLCMYWVAGPPKSDRLVGART